MNSRRRLLKVLLPAAVAAAGLGWIASNGLASNLVYYETPSDLAHAAPGQRVRLGGYVEPGSLERSGGAATFTVTDGQRELRVVQQGGVPSLFKEGRGVIVEGALGSDGVFHGDTVLVKHDANYQPPAPGEKPEARG